mmetsp:Transcript_8779/g.18552  ORF Transcript_8779/g.18552 Transcript_8779/m.18552 type:complete len:735 (+) Transcript_8779:385-2589(+)
MDGYHHDLTRRQPEGPLAPVVLAEDRKHALHAPEHGAVHDDGPREFLPLLLGPRVVLQLEPDGELEVQLDRGALVHPLHGVHDLDVDLGPVEGPVLGVDLPPALAGEGVHGPGQGRLGAVPEGLLAQGLLGPRGQLELVGHPKGGVHAAHEVQRPRHLRLDLVLPAEDVGVVLLEAPDAREAREGAGELVAVQDAEIGVADGEVAVGADRGAEHEAVARAVHGLHGPLLPLDVEAEHGVLVVHGVAGLVPEVEVVDVGGDDLVVAALPVVVLDEVDERVVDAGSVGQPEGGASGEVVEHDEFLLCGDAAVITLLCLLLVLLPNLQHLLVRERDPVHPLQRVVLRVSQPIRGAVPRGRERLDPAGVGQVRPAAQVDEVAALVHGRAAAVGDLGLDDLLLEGVAGEQAEGLVLGDDEPLEFLFLFGDFGDLGLDGLVVVLPKRVARTHVTVVIKPSRQRGADRQSTSVQVLQRLPQNVSARMPKHRLGVRVAIEFEKFELGNVADEGTGQIPQNRFADPAFAGTVIVLVVVSALSQHYVPSSLPLPNRIVIGHVIRVRDPRHHSGIGQSLRDRRRDVVRGRLPRFETRAGLSVLGQYGAVRHGHGDRDGSANLGFGVATDPDGRVRFLPDLEPFGILDPSREGFSSDQTTGGVVHSRAGFDVGATALDAAAAAAAAAAASVLGFRRRRGRRLGRRRRILGFRGGGLRDARIIQDGEFRGLVQGQGGGDLLRVLPHG